MCTFDVPGANPDNKDTLTPGCWAERIDGWKVLVESVEDGQVSYFVLYGVLTVGYRSVIPEADFKSRFTWNPSLDKDGDYEEEELVWIWHRSSSNRPFPIASFSVVAN